MSRILAPLAGALILLAFPCAAAQAPASPEAPAPKPWDPAAAKVALRGVVRFEGAPRELPAADSSGDPWCAKHCADAAALRPVLCNPDGTLRDAFVWISAGLEGWTFPVPDEPVLLDQRECRFVPRVLGVRAGQKLRIRNSDATSHNVQALPKRSDPFNFLQAEEGGERDVVFARPETMVRLKCNMHAWMAAWAGVVSHPFFAVSAADGRFEIRGLPAGPMTISAWHELCGRVDVVVPADKPPPELSLVIRTKSK